MTFANASEAIERIRFVARESNLPYTTLDAIDEIREAVDFYEDWQEEKGKLEAQIVQLETANEQLQERIEELESAP